jgi:hypothetical protein
MNEDRVGFAALGLVDVGAAHGGGRLFFIGSLGQSDQ